MGLARLRVLMFRRAAQQLLPNKNGTQGTCRALSKDVVGFRVYGFGLRV